MTIDYYAIADGHSDSMLEIAKIMHGDEEDWEVNLKCYRELFSVTPSAERRVIASPILASPVIEPQFDVPDAETIPPA